MTRLVLLNAFPLNAIPEEYSRFTVFFKRVSVSDLKKIAENAEVVNFIRHESTVKAVSSILGRELASNTGLYQWRPGDVIIVVTLKKPERGKELDASIDDLQITICEVIPARVEL